MSLGGNWPSYGEENSKLGLDGVGKAETKEAVS